MDIFITIVLAVCIGYLVTHFFVFVRECIVLVAKAIAHQSVSVSFDEHIIWMGVLAGIIFLLLN